MAGAAIRNFTGLTIQSFGFAAAIADGFLASFILPDRYPVSRSGPLPSEGLVYACYPKHVPWYYNEVTIVSSWYWPFFMMLIMIGTMLRWRAKPQKPASEFNGVNAVALLFGIVSGIAFVFAGAEPVALWLLTKGFGPPSLPCFFGFVGT